MKKNILLIMIVFASFSVDATIRTDLKDRTKEEVLAKSYYLGNCQPLSDVTCHIVVDGKYHASGIALDPYTVLTSAHMKDFEKKDDILVTFAPHATPEEILKGERTWKISQRPIIHPQFVYLGTDNLPNTEITSVNNKFFIGGIYLPTLFEMQFEEFKSLYTKEQQLFYGPDLAILKLDSPLPFETYPEFHDLDHNVVNEKALSLGFGPQRYNSEKDVPPLVDEEQLQSYKRHLISTRVSGDTFHSAHVLYARYEGPLRAGRYGFVPKENMFKTEGIPLDGDSGGPLLIKSEGDDTHELIGIASAAACVEATPLQFGEGGMRSLKKMFDECSLLFQMMLEVKGYAGESPIASFIQDTTQPIFPMWTDVRYYADWIKSKMGPAKPVS